jgi:hypothetical protein
MTLLEIEQSLPNGLHDSEVRRITVDYEHVRATIDLAVWVGDMDDPPERREAYKEGQLEIFGLLFMAIEAPDPAYPFEGSTKLIIDGCDATKFVDKQLLNSLPPRAFVRSFFVEEWNSFIHIAANDAVLAWKNDGAITYRRRCEHFAAGETMTSDKKATS